MNSVDIFPSQFAQTRRFTLGTPRTITVSRDGEQVFFLRSRTAADPVLCLWRIDIGTKTEVLLVDPREIESAGDLPAEELARRERARESAEGIVSYTLSSNDEQAVFCLAGNLYCVDLATTEITAIVTPPGVFDPRINPTGTHIAYVHGQDLRLAEIGVAEVEGTDRLLKADQDPLVSWGRAEFIAGEEMSRTRGYWWAPKGDSLLATRVDDNPVERRWISDPANPATAPREVRYPEAGTANSSVQLAHISLDGRTSTVDWSQGEFEYLADVVWTAERGPLVVRQPRDQRSVSIAEIDLATSSVTEIYRMDNEHWVELMPGSPRPCAQGLLTIEDRPDNDTRMLCLNGLPLGPAGLQVRALLSLQGDNALVTASEDPTEIHLVKISLLDGSITRLSDEPGVHSAVVGGSTTVVTSVSPERPGSQAVISGRTGDITITSYAATPALVARPIFLKLGERRLASALFLPEGHDGGTQLPVLLDPYGGPHAQRVLKSHNGHLVSQWFANQGFAVLVADGRGTPGRGPAFEREVWGDLAAPVLEDQIDALDAAGELYPFLDLGRVGIRGWSFGGYLAALAVLRRPDRFHAAIAGAPVTTWHLYDTHYTERYLGHPEAYPEHYRQSDLISEADKLGSPLLLVHGLADDNVVAAHTLRLSSALLSAGRAHQVLPLSGVTHMTPQVSVAENLLLLQRDFLRQHLAGNQHGAGPQQGAGPQ